MCNNDSETPIRNGGFGIIVTHNLRYATWAIRFAQFGKLMYGGIATGRKQFVKLFNHGNATAVGKLYAVASVQAKAVIMQQLHLHRKGGIINDRYCAW